MAIKMLVFDSVEELKAYENKQVKEEVSVDLEEIAPEEITPEEITPEEIEERKPYIDLSEKDTSRSRKKWTARERSQFKRILKESKEKGLTCHKALKVASQELKRTTNSLSAMKFDMGIKYSKLKGIIEDIEPQPNQRRRWTNSERVTLHKHLKECKKQGLSYSDAMKSCAKTINRPQSSTIWTLSKMGVKYSEMKLHTPVFISTGSGNMWSKAEEDYLVAETKPFCDGGKRIPKKVYAKLCKRLNRPLKRIKARVYYLKQEGKIAKILPEEQREIMTRKIRKGRKPQEKKDKSSDEGYMIKDRPTIMDRMKNFGKVSKEGNLFSNVLTNQQEDLLKGMIQNDIKIRGLSKITQEKLSLLMNLDGDDFEKFLIDVSKNAKKLKRYFKISVVSLNKDVSGQYIVFS